MSGILAPQQFDVDVDGGTANSARWTIWIRRFLIYITASGIKTDVTQIALLLHVGGEKVEEIYAAKRDMTTQVEDEKLDVICKLLTDHFAPQSNSDIATLTFRQAFQRKGEGINAFTIRLRTLAVGCLFGDTIATDLQIKLQIIQGSTNPKIKQKAAQTTPIITLKDMILYALSLEFCSEISLYQKSDMSYGIKQEAMVCQLYDKKGSQARRNEKQKCFKCGFDYPHDGKCPAEGQKCKQCGKLNHFSKCCKSKKSNSFKKAHQIIVETEKLVEEDETEIDDTIYSVYALKTNKVDCPRIKVTILDTIIEMGVDTQASINAISSETYLKMMNRPKLQSSTTKVFSFDGTKPMESLGKFSATIHANAQSIITEFIVLKNVKDNLLSFQLSQDLKLVQLLYQITSDDFKKKTIETFPELFSGKIGKLKNVHIELHIDNTIKSSVAAERRIPYHLKEKFEEAIDEMIKDDIIEPVIGEATPFISEMVLVPKPNNPLQIRCTLDSRVINKCIKREHHSMPTVEDLKAKIVGAKVMSKLDIRGGYHHLEIHKKSRYITAFRSPRGIHRYKRMVMGISSAAEIFQREIEKLLEGLKGAMNLSDDIYVWGDSYEQHDNRLYIILEKLQSEGVGLNSEKCELRKTELDFFGMHFTSEGVRVTDEKIKALRDAPIPKSKSELRSFLGIVSYCSQSIPKFADNSSLLRSMTHKHARMEWKQECIDQFEFLKNVLTTKCLGYFDKDWCTILETDASPIGASSVLYQSNPKNKNEHKIIAFWSKAFSDIELRYSQVEREALAVVLACEKHKLYLLGKPFTLRVDNRAIEIIYNNPNSNPPCRIKRFSLRLTDYDFKVEHVPGIDNIADYLSRNPIERIDINDETVESEQFIHFIACNNVPRAICIEEFMEETKKDLTLTRLITALKTGREFTDSIQSFKHIKNELSVYQDSIVMRGSTIVVPASLQLRCATIAHEGHQGVVKTKRLLRERVWFPKMDKLIESIISSCKSCQLTSRGNRSIPIVSSIFPQKAWTILALDFFGPLCDGQELLVIIDEHSKFPVVVTVKTTSFQYVIPKLKFIFS